MTWTETPRLGQPPGEVWSFSQTCETGGCL